MGSVTGKNGNRFVSLCVCGGGQVLGDWTRSFVPGKCSATETIPRPFFSWFHRKVYLSIGNSSNSREKRKCVYVLKRDSCLFSEWLPGPSLYLQSANKAAISTRIPSSALFILASKRLGLKSPGSPWPPVALFISLVPGSRAPGQVACFPVGRFWTMGLATSQGLWPWCQAAWRLVYDCKRRSWFRFQCLKAPSTVWTAERQTG